jgi:hypothetical protein
MNEVIIALLTGGAAAGLIKLIDGVIQAGMSKRGETLKDLKETLNVLCKDVAMVTHGQRVLFHDRIIFVCKSYLEAGSISLAERESLIEMHNQYHAIGGNGNLDLLMVQINELPLRGI